MKKRILVTGGAGFIGSHLCERLLREGNHVICMDDLSTGREENILPLKEDSGFEFIRHDVTEPFAVEVDQIYNLACPASPVQYQSDPVKTATTNVWGAMNALELARRTGARILQASTSEVYGDPHQHPQPETYWGHVSPIGLRACYDEGKRMAETLFFCYYREKQTDIKVVRIFNTYGPRMSSQDGRVVSNFIVQALKNEDITIYGTGDQTRCFQYIDDLVEGMIRMMDSPAGFTGPVNLGNPVEFTVLELARQVLALTGSRSKLAYRPLPADDPVRRRPDTGLAERNLHWKAQIGLEEGLQRTIEYFKAGK